MSTHPPATNLHNTLGFKYRAFISYAHADRRDNETWGRFVHRKLESFHVPKDLVGRIGDNGIPIPARLYPLFLDREEFPADDRLGEKIKQALDDSEQMIVVCSPAAKNSRWVNEEILQYKRLRRGSRIVAIIVDGEPNAKDPTRGCFPRALTHLLDENLQLSDTTVEILAADIREAGDGEHDAIIKLASGLLGVGLNDLKRRKEAEERRASYFFRIVAATLLIIFATLTVIATWFYHDATIQRDVAEMQRDRATKALSISTNSVSKMLSDIAIRYRDSIGFPRSAVLEATKLVVAQTEEIRKLDAKDPELLRVQSVALREAAETLGILNMSVEAESTALQSISTLEQYFPSGPICKGKNWVPILRDLALAYRVLGDAQSHLRSVDVSQRSFERSIQLFDSAHACKEATNFLASPNRAENLDLGLSQALNRLSDVLMEKGQRGLADLSAARSVSVSNRLLATDRTNVDFAIQYVRSRLRQIRFSPSNNTSDQLEKIRNLISLMQLIVTQNPKNQRAKLELKNVIDALSYAHLQNMDGVSAEIEAKKGYRLISVLLTSDKQNTSLLLSFSESLRLMAKICEWNGSIEDQTNYWRKDGEIWKTLLMSAPYLDNYKYNYSESLLALSLLEKRRGNKNASLDFLTRSHEYRRQVANSNPNIASYQLGWAETAISMMSGDLLSENETRALIKAMFKLSNNHSSLETRNQAMIFYNKMKAQ